MVLVGSSVMLPASLRTALPKRIRPPHFWLVVRLREVGSSRSSRAVKTMGLDAVPDAKIFAPRVMTKEPKVELTVSRVP